MSKILETSKHDILFLNGNNRTHKKLIEIAKIEIKKKLKLKCATFHNIKWIKDKNMIKCKLEYLSRCHDPSLIIIDFDDIIGYRIFNNKEYFKAMLTLNKIEKVFNEEC